MVVVIDGDPCCVVDDVVFAIDVVDGDCDGDVVSSLLLPYIYIYILMYVCFSLQIICPVWNVELS